MMECQECGQELESADTPHEYGDCLIYRERMEERQAWRAEAERMIEEYRANAEKESFEYKDNWNAAADGLEELLKNMEARNGNL